MPFAQLGLRSELTEAVAAKGYDTPSPIQQRAIPAILDRRDVLGGAQTGTGKTAAFALPLLQLLTESDFKSKRPRALVLTPTRELAAQVHQSFRDYGSQLKQRSAVIFGGVGFQPQISAFRRGLDIVVATPGRLLDLCQRGDANLSGIEFLVLDEADRMLDMGFVHDIRKILKLLPDDRQNLFFSATYSKDVKKLADSILRDPVEVEVAPRNATADRVDQEAYIVGQKSKRAVLAAMINDGNWSQVLIFTRTKHGANRLATQLGKDGIDAMAIHGNKSQGARERALAAFKANKIQALVATDIAARGLDIADLPHVVNYELPNVPEDYVHRIGRTGRAGKEGTAISLVSESEEAYLTDIEKLLKRSIPIYAMNKDGTRREVQLKRSPAERKAAAKKARTDRAQKGRSGGGRGRSAAPNGNRSSKGKRSANPSGESNNSGEQAQTRKRRRRPNRQGKRQRGESKPAENANAAPQKKSTFRKLTGLLSRR